MLRWLQPTFQEIDYLLLRAKCIHNGVNASFIGFSHPLAYPTVINHLGLFNLRKWTLVRGIKKNPTPTLGIGF